MTAERAGLPRRPHRLAAALAVLALGAAAWWIPDQRRALIAAVTRWDAPVGDPPALPAATGAGLAPVARTRVVLIDGLSEAHARGLPAWSALCRRGLTLRVDVGFPTVSLPVQVALWTGLTQQQTGVVYRYNRPLTPPLGPPAIPAQVPGSIAIVEGVVRARGGERRAGNYGWIVRSLGFSHVEPAAEPARPLVDADGLAWSERWEARAREAVAGPSPLALVHVLRVDVAGHAHGMGVEYLRAAAESDALLGALVALAPDARWLAISDHGHLPTGGHGGEEVAVRQVQACLAGPGVPRGEQAPGEAIHLVDVSRAIADSTGAVLDREARGRPLRAALDAPLRGAQAIPPLAPRAGAAAIFALVAGLALAAWSVRAWWLAPWWYLTGIAALLVVRGEPTLSTPMIYAPEGRELWLAWAPALPLATAATWLGLRTTSLARTLVAQLGIPIAAAAAALTACGAWPALAGAAVAPVVPRYTAYASPALLMVAWGAAAVGLAVLATLVRPPSDRSAPAAPPRTERAAASPAPAPGPRDRAE